MNYDAPQSQGSLFDFLDRQAQLAGRKTALDRLNEVVDWEGFRDVLEHKLAYADRSKGGRPPKDPVLMLKMCVLQDFYGLSDEQTEFQVLDRFSFQRFLGLSVGDAVPDANTLRVFKERLGAQGVRELFDLYGQFLRDKGLIGHAGKIVDASIVEVPRQRNSREDNERIKGGERPEEFDRNPHRGAQKDTDARWLRKNGKNHYGYKNHAKVDAASKLIEDYQASSASVHDSQALGALVREGDQWLYADSAYAGESIRREVEGKKVACLIHEKGAGKRKLTEAQVALNRLKSKTRVRVEHVFGWQWWHGGTRLRTIGIERARRGIGMRNLVYNLFRVECLVRLGRAAA